MGIAQLGKRTYTLQFRQSMKSYDKQICFTCSSKKSFWQSSGQLHTYSLQELIALTMARSQIKIKVTPLHFTPRSPIYIPIIINFKRLTFSEI